MKKKVVKPVNKNVDASELIIALNELEKEEGISKDYMLPAIENALVTAFKRNFEVTTDNVKVTIDDQTGETHIYMLLNVVRTVKDPKLEISAKEAKKVNAKYKAGDVLEKELAPKEFGRIAAQTAKQVIIQKIRELSRENITKEFTDKKGEIVTGLIQKADKNIVVVDLGKVEGVMLAKDQIPTEKYSVNQKIRACISDVKKGLKGAPQILISRSNPDFVRKLFELEIPEIYEGLIEIKAISRDPGKRCKVAVYSPDENIDPVGSCVGQKGVRIQNIINELNGEKIDVIEWNPDLSTFIAEALLPAQVLAVDLKPEDKFAQVIVADDQLSLAIGKAGQNARLAAKLTDNWTIDIKSETQFRAMLESMNSEEVAEDEKAQEVKEEVEEIEENIATEEVEEVKEEAPKKRGRKKKTEEASEEATEEVVEEKKKKTSKKKATKKEESEE